MWSTESLACSICFYLAPFCSGTRKERCGAHLGTITQIWAYRLINLLPFLQGGPRWRNEWLPCIGSAPDKSYRTLVRRPVRGDHSAKPLRILAKGEFRMAYKNGSNFKI